MRTVSKLCLLSMVVVLASCNEQISPELQKAGSTTTTTDDDGLIVPDEYYFKLSNTSSAIRNFKLHKTGNNNLTNDKCQITSSSKFSAADASINDITCYFDAEELSLRFGGFSWEAEASPNTCEFIRYSPFSYYNRMPGKSFGTYNKTTCVGAVLAGEITAGYPDCGSYVSSSDFRGLAAADNQFTLSSDAELCRFNYTNKDKEQCDNGSVTVSEVVITEVFDDLGVRQPSTVTVVPIKTVTCGGKAANCISGPIKNHSEITATKGSILTEAVYDKVTKYAVSYPSLYPNGPDNYHYANFRRDLSHTNVAFTNSLHDYLIVDGKKTVNFSGLGDNSDGTTDYVSAAYNDFWTALSTTDLKAFNANEVERYSRNLIRTAGVYTSNLSTTFDYSKVSADPLDYTILENNSILDDQYTARPYAYEPFVGLGNGYETNPIYTFTCLDNTYETKARIRVFVREWDKVLPTTDAIEYVTDISRSGAKQDLQRDIETVGSNDDSNDYNDVIDWDDMISMEKFPTYFQPAVKSVAYPDGYFETSYFPNFDKP